MFVLAGLGQKVEDIPVGVIKYLKKADFVFLESYTNIPNYKIIKFLKRYKRNIEEVYREFVETKLEEFILKNKDKTILLLVYGNPLYATTHISLIKFCKENKIRYKVIGASSVYDYIGLTGLFIYKFGKTVSVPFHKSETPYLVIKKNYENNLHTLILLDIDPENKRYLKPNEALIKLIELEEKYKEGLFDLDKKIIICEKLGTDKQKIYYITIRKALDMVFDVPSCIIYPAILNKIEEENLKALSDHFE